jgi:hypothetical protein
MQEAPDMLVPKFLPAVTRLLLPSFYSLQKLLISLNLLHSVGYAPFFSLLFLDNQ